VSLPGLKQVKAVSAAVAALALLAGPLAYANHREGFLAHNVEHEVQPWAHSSCFVVVQHGNVFGTAYAKIKTTSPSCKGLVVKVTALKDGKWVSTPPISIPNPRVGRWYQANVYYANIISSSFEAHPIGFPVRSWSYSGI
jgi:hypothetical protein